MNYQNYQNLMLLTSSDTKQTLHASILVYKFRPEITGFNMYAEYTQPHNKLSLNYNLAEQYLEVEIEDGCPECLLPAESKCDRRDE